MLLAFSLTACGAGAAGGANDAGSQDASQAAGQTTGESGAEGTGAQADTEDSALPSTMEDGEVVLGQGDVQSHFEGTLPDGTISWSDDMAAWIKIPGAGVDTAVEAAQTDGSVYLNPENSSAFNDPNTVIHGPADTEDAALHGILAYGDQDFFQKNPYVYVYLPDGSVFEYKVFAAYAAAPEDILKQHDCYDFDAFSSYVQEILSQRSMSAVTDPSMQDQILGTWCMLTLEATTILFRQRRPVPGARNEEETAHHNCICGSACDWGRVAADAIRTDFCRSWQARGWQYCFCGRLPGERRHGFQWFFRKWQGHGCWEGRRFSRYRSWRLRRGERYQSWNRRQGGRYAGQQGGRNKVRCCRKQKERTECRGCGSSKWD